MTWYLAFTNRFERLRVKAWHFVDRTLFRPYRIHVVQELLPDRLERRTLYIVEEDGFREQAALLCPCGLNHILHLNLLPDERPLWRVKEHSDGTATLKPSVWRKKDCRSHFWFRRGRVKWVPNLRKQ